MTHSKSDPIVVYGSGYIIKGDTIELQDNVSMKEFAEAFPFFKASEWGLLCINIEDECDGFGHRFITYKIKARIGEYLKNPVTFSFTTYAGEPNFPDWLDAEYDPDRQVYNIYGLS
jgi:hypothetical protein